MRLDTLLSHFTASLEAVQKIPVNTASVDRLAAHPYLRYEQAKAIYSLRRKHIRLSSVEELRSIPELTDEEIHRMEPYLSFENGQNSDEDGDKLPIMEEKIFFLLHNSKKCSTFALAKVFRACPT